MNVLAGADCKLVKLCYCHRFVCAPLPRVFKLSVSISEGSAGGSCQHDAATQIQRAGPAWAAAQLCSLNYDTLLIFDYFVSVFVSIQLKYHCIWRYWEVNSLGSLSDHNQSNQPQLAQFVDPTPDPTPISGSGSDISRFFELRCHVKTIDAALTVEVVIKPTWHLKQVLQWSAHGTS